MATDLTSVAIKDGFSQLLHCDGGLSSTETAVLDGDGTSSTLSLGTTSATIAGNLVISGNLTVSGTTTEINTQTLNVADNIVVLNNDVTGTPSQNAGIEVERGTSTNTLMRWNESTDRWQFTNDGSTYYNIPITSELGSSTFRTVTAGGNTLGASETLAFTEGSNITITESGGAVTIASTDTNTDTVDMGDGFRFVYVDGNVQVTENKYLKLKTVDGSRGFGSLLSGDGSSSSPWIITLPTPDTDTNTTDLNSLSVGAINTSNDSFGFIDADDSNSSKKESIADFLTAISGSGISASSGQLNRDSIALGGLSNVSSSSPSTGDFLKYGGSQWEPTAVSVMTGWKLRDSSSASNDKTVTEGKFVKIVAANSGSYGDVAFSGSTGETDDPFVVSISAPNTDRYVNDVSFNTSTGVLTLTRAGSDSATVTEDLDGRYLSTLTGSRIDSLLDVAALHTGGGSGYGNISNGQYLVWNSTANYFEPATLTSSYSWYLRDGDTTAVEVTSGKYVKLVEGTGIDINFTDTSSGAVDDEFDVTITNTLMTSGGTIGGDTTVSGVLTANTRLVTTEIRGSSVAIKDANADLMAWFQDGSSRLYSNGYNLRLEASNELNLYNGNTAATLHISYNGTGSSTDISNSELTVVKGTGSTFGGNVTQNSGTLLIKNAGGDSSGLKIYQDSSDVSRIYNNYNGELVFGVSNAEKMSIDGNANVTIGTFNMTSPNTGYRHFNAGAFGVMHREAYDSYILSNTYYNSSGAFIAKHSDSHGIGAIYLLGGDFSFNTYDGSVSAGSSYAVSTKFHISKNGSIGINTDTPTSMVDIAASTNNDFPLKIRGNIDNSGGYTGIKFGYEANTGNYEKCAIKVEGTSGNVQPNFHILLNSAASSADVSADNTDAKFTILNNGRIGISNSSPSSGLHLTGADNTASKLTLTNTAPSPDNTWSLHPEYNSQDLTLSEDSNQRVTFKSGGNVSIGGTGGYQKLTVEGGNIYMSGGQTITWSNGNATINNTGYELRFSTYSGSALVERMRIESDGDVHCDADVIAFSSTIGSDRRLKKNIADIKYGLNDVLKLRGVEFDWNRKDYDKKHDVGFIAQEVREVIPELVKRVNGLNNKDSFLTVDYAKLVPVLVESIKELKQEIKDLKNGNI